MYLFDIIYALLEKSIKVNSPLMWQNFNPCSQCSLNIVWLISQKKSLKWVVRIVYQTCQHLILYCNKKILKNTFCFSFFPVPQVGSYIHDNTQINFTGSFAHDIENQRAQQYEMTARHNTQHGWMQATLYRKMNVQDLPVHHFTKANSSLFWPCNAVGTARQSSMFLSTTDISQHVCHRCYCFCPQDSRP